MHKLITLTLAALLAASLHAAEFTSELAEQYATDVAAADLTPAELGEYTAQWAADEDTIVSVDAYTAAMLTLLPTPGEWDDVAAALSGYRYTGGRATLLPILHAWYGEPLMLESAQNWWADAVALINPMHVPDFAWFAFGIKTILGDLPGFTALDPRLIALRTSRQGLSPDEARSWALLQRRIPLTWTSVELQVAAKNQLITLITSGLTADATALQTYIYDGEGDDPLAGVTYTGVVADAIEAIDSEDDYYLRAKGDFAPILSDAFAQMSIADLGGNAAVKTRQAERIALTLYSRDGTLTSANAWLDAVNDETWQDYDLGL